MTFLSTENFFSMSTDLIRLAGRGHVTVDVLWKNFEIWIGQLKVKVKHASVTHIVLSRVDWSKASIRYDHAHVIFLEIYSFHLYEFFKKLWKKCFSWLKWVFSFCCLDDDLTAILSCICMAAFIFSIILCVAMWSETWFQHV